jgi:hypothetical protein
MALSTWDRFPVIIVVGREGQRRMFSAGGTVCIPCGQIADKRWAILTKGQQNASPESIDAGIPAKNQPSFSMYKIRFFSRSMKNIQRFKDLPSIPIDVG